VHPRIAQGQVPLGTEQVDEVLVTNAMQGAGLMELRSRILMSNVWIFFSFQVTFLYYRSMIIPFKLGSTHSAMLDT
jgi:hypothetical protein